MARNYQKEAEEYDRSLYLNGDEPDLTPDDNNDLSLDADSNPVDDMGEESATPAAEPEEETVPKSQYDAAVKAMNAAQRELAELRKQQSTSESAEEAAEMAGDGEEANEESSEMAGNQDFESIIANLEDLGFDDFTPALRYLKSQIDRANGVADDYIGYRKQLHTDAFWKAISDVHPDYESFLPPSDDSIEPTDEQKQYTDWFSAQDQETKDLLSANSSAEQVISGLNKFRADVPKSEPMQDEEITEPELEDSFMSDIPAKPSKLEQARAEASPMISTSKRGKDKKIPTSMDEIRKMSNEDFFANEDEILNS
jgi:hypothetical protein